MDKLIGLKIIILIFVFSPINYLIAADYYNTHYFDLFSDETVTTNLGNRGKNKYYNDINSSLRGAGIAYGYSPDARWEFEIQAQYVGKTVTSSYVYADKSYNSNVYNNYITKNEDNVTDVYVYNLTILTKWKYFLVENILGNGSFYLYLAFGPRLIFVDWQIKDGNEHTNIKKTLTSVAITPIGIGYRINDYLAIHFNNSFDNITASRGIGLAYYF